MSHGQDSFDKNYYKRFFNEYSSTEFDKYVRWFYGWFNFLNKYVYLHNGHGKKVLEIGCSIGAFAKVLSDHNFQVTATDISEYILKKASCLQKGVNFLKLDAEKEMKLKDSFEYIFAFEAVEHMKNPEQAFKNIIKKINSDGSFIFSTPFPTSRSLSDPTHINVHDPSWWMELGKQVGFKERKLVFVSFIPFLYRFSKLFSFAFPLKLDIPLVNSTAIFIFKK